MMLFLLVVRFLTNKNVGIGNIMFRFFVMLTPDIMNGGYSRSFHWEFVCIF